MLDQDTLVADVAALRTALRLVGHGRARVLTPVVRVAGVLAEVDIPVQAVGGLTVEQVLQLPEYGVYHLVLGAPLTVDADAFKSPAHDLEGLLKEIIARLGDDPSRRA